jgi:hypothetical protein
MRKIQNRINLQTEIVEEIKKKIETEANRTNVDVDYIM